MRKTVIRILAGAAATAMLSVVGAEVALADDAVEKVTQFGVVSTENYRSPAAHVVGKNGASKKTSGLVQPMVTGSGGVIRGYASKSIAPSGVYGTFDQGFTSYYSASSGWKARINVSSGSSYTRWLGSTPWNATSLALTDRIWVGGVSVSISIGTSPSGSVSVVDNGVTMSNSVPNSWRNYHYFSNIAFESYWALWGPYESSNAAATFGWATYYNNIN